MEIKLNNLMLSNEQVETIAFNVYRDIEEYIKIHYAEYADWLIDYVVNSAVGYIMDLYGGFVNINDSNYKYKICNYIVKE